MNRNQFLFLLFFLLFFQTISYSQTQDNLLNKRIILKSGSYKLKILVEAVNTSNSVVITYNGEYISPEGLVTVTVKNPTIQQLLSDIEKSLSVSCLIRNNFIILQPKQQDNTFKITGLITDENTEEPLPGANIFIKNTLMGTITDDKGTFELILDNRNQELKISYIGYKTEYIDLSKTLNNDLKISLEPDVNFISEVKVVSKLRKFYNLDLGRPLETMNSFAIENTNVNNVSDILNGRFAGIWGTQTSGMPGDHQRIYIRGISSIFGSVDPLYVIDGVSVPMVNLRTLGIADLNTHDIENITILKDASSTALFGFQGGNGVILIDTKHEKKRNEISFYTKQGVQWFPARYDLMGTEDFLASMDSSESKIGIHIRQYYPAYSDTLANTDWQDRIFQAGKISEYQLSGSGTFLNTGFYLSGNYMNNLGIIKNSSYTRYSLAANIGRTFFKKLSIELGYRGSVQENRNNLDGYGGNQVIFEGINKSPCLLSTPSEFYYLNSNEFAYRIYQEYNPLSSYRSIDSVILKTKKTLDVATNMFRGALRYDFTDHLYLKFSSDISLRKYQYLTDIQKDSVELRGTYQRNNDLTPRIVYIKSDENVIVVNYMLNLKWGEKINNHEFSVFSGLKFYKDLVYWSDTVANEWGLGNEEYNSISTSDDAYIRNSMSIHGPSGNVYRNINSILGNFNYNYKAKYFVSLAGNYENLIEGTDLNEKQFFPSVAVSWDIAREKFLDGLHFMNHLKIYSSWGRAGNYPLNGLSQDIYSYETHVNWNDTTQSGKYIDQLANHSLKPEIVEEYNVGASIDLFKNSRVMASFDIYNKINRNLIIMRDIPGYFGGGEMFYNIGEIETRGKEITIEILPVLTENITWYSKFNFTSYAQKVNKLDLDSVIKFMNTDDILLPSFMITQNQDLGVIYGYKYLGSRATVDYQGTALSRAYYNGLFYLNADSSNARLEINDMVPIGNSIPRLIMNWYNSFSFKNITMDMLWSAVLGVDKYNSTRAATYVAGTNREINTFIYDSIYAIASTSLNNGSSSEQDPYAGAFYQSSYFVEDASFIRLKQLVFSYSPEWKLCNRIDMKFSLILENLVTLTHYKGYDPETSIYTDNNFSDNAIDRGAYPNPKSFYISITLTY